MKDITEQKQFFPQVKDITEQKQFSPQVKDITEQKQFSPQVKDITEQKQLISSCKACPGPFHPLRVLARRSLKLTYHRCVDRALKIYGRLGDRENLSRPRKFMGDRENKSGRWSTAAP